MDIINHWQLQEAKNKLSQLVKEADQGIPQCITVRGKKTVIVLSVKDYEALKRPASSLSSALLMPLLDEDESLFERNHDTGRNIDL